MKPMLFRKIKTAVAALILAGGCLLGIGVGVSAHRAPAPTDHGAPGQGSYVFVPINKDWSKRTVWLQREDTDAGIGGGSGGGSVVEPAHDAKFKASHHREDRYFAHEGDKQPCKVVQSYPSGSLEREIDVVNKDDKTGEQFYRCLYPDGSAASFVHWKDGKVIDATSVSHDGRVTQRVKDGDGRLIAYAAKGDNRTESWYGEGFPYLEKNYRAGACVQIRLNDGEDCYFSQPSEEQLSLSSRKEFWSVRAGGEAQYQRTDSPVIICDHGEQAAEHAKAARQYPKRRADFMKAYGKRLEKAGKTWAQMKIAFIRDDKPWPE